MRPSRRRWEIKSNVPMTSKTAIQAGTSVAYLGPEGTFSQAALLQHFDEDRVVLRACNSIDEVFAAVESDDVTFGVVPVENSTEGAINNTQDCLIDSTVKTVGEEVVQIKHNLLRQKGAGRTEIVSIASHEQSLAQCRNWLRSNFPDTAQLPCSSNAQAAMLAVEDDTVAAIAGEIAATVYDLDIIYPSIQDQQHNSTRFLILGKIDTTPSKRDKTSVIIYTENKPGALFRILEPFERLQVSLTKIETRPSKKQAWEYAFFMDFEGHEQDRIVQELFEELQSCTAEIKVLGSYASFE